MALVLTPWPTDPAAVLAAVAAVRFAFANSAISVQSRDSATQFDQVIERVAEAVSAQIERYAPGAPDAIRTEALIRFASWIMLTPAAFVQEKVADPSGTTIDRMYANSGNGFRRSGARSLLSSWRIRRLS